MNDKKSGKRLKKYDEIVSVFYTLVLYPFAIIAGFDHQWKPYLFLTVLMLCWIIVVKKAEYGEEKSKEKLKNVLDEGQKTNDYLLKSR